MNKSQYADMRPMRSALWGNGSLTYGSRPSLMKYSMPRKALIGEKSASVSRWTSAATSCRYGSACSSICVSLPVQYMTTEGWRRAKATMAAYSESGTRFGDSTCTSMPSSSVASRYSSGGTKVWKRTKLNPSSFLFAVTIRQ